MKCVNTFLTILLFVACICSCKRLPLYDPTTNVYLSLDLKLNTDIDLNEGVDLDGDPALRDKVYGVMPETVRACFYSAETHKLVAEEFLPAEGGFVDIPAGFYNIIVYSLGAEVTRTSGTESRAGAYAYTSETGSTVRIAKGSDDTKSVEDHNIIFEPDHIFTGTKENVEIPVHAMQDGIFVINIEMTTLVDTYTLEVRYIEGAGRVQKADVYITGQAPLKYMWDRRYSNKPAAIYFESDVDPKKGNLFTIFNTFGKFPNARNDVYLNVLVTDVSGGRYQWVYDVTDQFDNPDNVTHEIIIEDRIIIPEGGGGFTHDVSDWDSEVIYVPL